MRSLSLVLLVAAALLLPASLLSAEDVLKPSKQMGLFRKQSRNMSAEEKKQYAIDYIAKWKASGQKTSAISRYALAQFQQLAEEWSDARTGFRVTWKNAELKSRTRDYGATAEAGLLLFPEVQAQMGQEALDKAATELQAYAKDMLSDPSRAKSRGKLLTVLARLHTEAGRYGKAHTLRMQVIKEDPKSIASQLMPVVRNLLASAHTMDGYDAMRKKAKSALDVMAGHHEKAVMQAESKREMMVGRLKATDPEAVDENGNLTTQDRSEMNKAERSVYGAIKAHENALKLMGLIKGADKAMAKLGKPAEAWTLEHAFGDVQDLAGLKGKVVLLDFWATWPDDCNFPVMRDFHKSFADKGLVIVGVTASAKVCYEHRYDFDEDLKSKHRGGRKFYAARLATETDLPDDSQAIFEEKQYREREVQAIEAFIGNHDLKWPNVMIEKEEPFAKFAVEGWPSLVVIDKQGRLRYVRSGKLARSSAGSVAAFKKILEAILAE
ncbi:MAG: TlpA disulfide reductase family protein [Planctomycetota bacterium]|nr:TlpA disulfide reductase family protein [Planctomycetota bacterium]